MTNIPRRKLTRRTGLVVCASVLVSMASLSAHIVRGLVSSHLATAFVSSPSAGPDAPVPIAWGAQDTRLRVACFDAANTSASRIDLPGWPQVGAIGIELPGQSTGFALVSPVDGDWALVENETATLADRGTVTLDFVIVPRANPVGNCRHGRPHEALGLPPGQPAVRGAGQRFCVSGPFPDTMTIEQILNGVVVRFYRVQPYGPSFDVGVWDNPARTIPLFP